jgi:hypothetical protein
MMSLYLKPVFSKLNWKDDNPGSPIHTLQGTSEAGFTVHDWGTERRKPILGFSWASVLKETPRKTASNNMMIFILFMMKINKLP